MEYIVCDSALLLLGYYPTWSGRRFVNVVISPAVLDDTILPDCSCSLWTAAASRTCAHRETFMLPRNIVLVSWSPRAIMFLNNIVSGRSSITLYGFEDEDFVC